MKYATGHVVGRGGMGVVYRSWDPQLERPVALKVLHRDGAESAERMVREARAQAGVAHPNVCQVYEVGVLDERPYIAMQWIDGVPLDEAVAELSLERKVHLFTTVVEAVQAAHAVGLVHRDLKPANILVERTADGELEPYVLDFGIARSHAAETALTRTGQVIGTPGYLSPEQARGDRDLDRRSDVFSLGCVLYELLGGETPFGGLGVEALVRVLEEEPVPLERLRPGMPRDLATIVAKCLEKDRERRYGSARELADDLRRFLAGETIRARPASLVYRWSRRARRHPIAAAAVAAAVVSVLVLTAVAVHSRATVAERARLAQRFGREVERVDAAMRLAHLADLHDIRPQKRELGRRLERLAAELPTLGRVAEGPGHFALGSGYSSLGSPRVAVAHLERSWESGYRTPEVAHELALALGTLYERALADAERLEDPAARVARREALARRLRDRVVVLLREAGASEQRPARLLEARLALYEERYHEAAELAAAAAESAPWFYEAHLVRGDALSRAVLARPRDDDVAERLAALGAADEAFARAAVEGRSDPRVHERRCELGLQMAGLQFFGPGGDLAPRLATASAACRRAAAADPDRARPHALLARLGVLASRDRSRRGEDPFPEVEGAVRAARRAVALDDEEAEHHRSLGDALGFRAEFERERGIDNLATLREAVAHHERAVAIEPWDAAGHNGLGLAHWELVYTVRELGEDPLPHLDAATAAFRRATELSSDYARAYSNLGAIYNLRIEREAARGLDPRASMDAAAEAFRRAIDADPGYVYAYNNLGNVFRHRGEDAVDRGRDPEPYVTEAIGWYRQASERNPAWAFPHLNTALAYHDLARWRVETGGDPGPALDGAAEAFRRGLEIKPDIPRAWRTAAMVELLRARHRLETGGDPAPALAAADRLLDRADELAPPSAFAFEQRARRELLAARAGAAERVERFRAAERHLVAALELQPESATVLTLLAELHWRRAQQAGRGVVERHLVRGLDAAERALAANPKAAEAEAVRGELLLLAADAERSSSQLAAAEAAFLRALDLRPSLERRLASGLERLGSRAGSMADRTGDTRRR